MKKFSTVIAACLLAVTFSGCSTLVGAGIGGYAGNKATDGSKTGTVGGAVLGGAIGSRF